MSAHTLPATHTLGLGLLERHHLVSPLVLHLLLELRSFFGGGCPLHWRFLEVIQHTLPHTYTLGLGFSDILTHNVRPGSPFINASL